jgi:hypothetical protein
MWRPVCSTGHIRHWAPAVHALRDTAAVMGGRLRSFVRYDHVDTVIVTARHGRCATAHRHRGGLCASRVSCTY